MQCRLSHPGAGVARPPDADSTGGSEGSATRFARSPRPTTAPVMRAARSTSFSAIALSRSSASIPGVWRPTEPTNHVPTIEPFTAPISAPPAPVPKTPSPAAHQCSGARRDRVGPPASASASRRSSSSEMSSTRSRSSRPRTRTPWCSSWNNGREMAAPPLNVETRARRTRASGSSITVVVSSAPEPPVKDGNHVVAPGGVLRPHPEPVRRVLRDPVGTGPAPQGRPRAGPVLGAKPTNGQHSGARTCLEDSVRPSRLFRAVRHVAQPRAVPRIGAAVKSSEGTPHPPSQTQHRPPNAKPPRNTTS